MKIFSNFITSIIGVSLLWASSVSCSKTTVENQDFTEKKIIQNIKKDSLEVDNQFAFHFPSLQRLADKSPILKKEGFGSKNDEIRFIVGDIIILSLGEKIIYLNLLPKTTEDDNYYIHLISQDLDNNFKIEKEWTINEESGNQFKLEDFYKNHKNEIVNIFKKNELQLQLIKKNSLKSYDQIKNIDIKTNKDNANHLNKIQVFSNNHNVITLDNKVFCPECDSLVIDEVDYIGEITNEESSIKVLVLGFLEKIEHSPSALHVRLVSIKDKP